MTAQESLDKFVEIIQNDEHHKNYDRTLAVAKFAYATATGDDIGDLVTSVRMRESEALKEQRLRITKPISPVSVEMVKKYFRKVRKAEGVKTSIDYPDQDTTRKERLIEQLSMFYAGQSAGEYLFDICEEYTFLDPNAFLVIERENVYEAGRLVGVRVFPIEFPCNEVRHYQYRHGVLDWLLIEQGRTEKAQGGRIEYNLSEFFLYGKGFTFHAVEYKETAPALVGTEGRQYQTVQVEVTPKQDARFPGTNPGRTRNFQYFIFATGTIEVPAIRLGAYLDGRTRIETAVTPMEPVNPLLENLINVGSLHDLTVFLHSIPRRRELVEACDYEDKETGFYCDSGYVNGSQCPRCKGTGDKSITSEQDMIRIVLPPNFSPADLPDLTKFAHTEPADVDLLRWQQEKLDWLMKFIVYATMTRDAVTMAEVARTATELTLNNQDAYDKMQPYAELYSQAWKLIVRVTAQYLEIADGLRVRHSFPDDFQFETEAELIRKRQEALNSGAPFEVVNNIDKQIIRKQTRSEEESARVFAWARWKPWPDLSDELVAVVLADRKPTDHDRMLRENFARVRREIEEETAGMFYLMPYERQRDLIDGKLVELAGSIQFRETQAADFGEFNLVG